MRRRQEFQHAAKDGIAEKVPKDVERMENPCRNSIDRLEADLDFWIGKGRSRQRKLDILGPGNAGYIPEMSHPWELSLNHLPGAGLRYITDLQGK